jgi:glycerophosphoryl diester phosphodiesterase
MERLFIVLSVYVVIHLGGALALFKASAQPLIVAHRGGASLAPENTMAAFRMALSLGVDALEFDVHFTQDSQFVVLHDPNLKRTAGVKGNVQKMNAGEVTRVGVGAHFHPAFHSEKVPLLDSVLAVLKGRLPILLEVKPQRANAELVVRCLLQKLEAYSAAERCTLISFDSRILEEARRQAPNLPYLKLITGRFPIFGWVIDTRLRLRHWIVSAQGSVGIGWYYKTLNPKLVKKIKNRNLQIFSWTVTQEKAIRKVKTWGLDGLITNDPELAQKIVTTDQ